MCGITCLLFNQIGITQFNKKTIIDQMTKNAELITHRGPDDQGVIIHKNIISSVNVHGITETFKEIGNCAMWHSRLKIVDPHSGEQPFSISYTSNDSNDSNINTKDNTSIKTLSTNDKQNSYNLSHSYNFESIYLAVNGEIYNHRSIREEYPEFSYRPNSDCAAIICLYYNMILKGDFSVKDMLNKLDGQFSFSLYDTGTNRLIVARDPIGITSLYSGFDEASNIYFSSEMKVLKNCANVMEFPPGHYIDTKLDNSFHPYYSESNEGLWMLENYNNLDTISNMRECDVLYSIVETLTKSVEKRLMTDVPFGLLLSGGLDSSLVCSIAVKLIRQNKNIAPIHTFSIGLEDSPDIEKAEVVAKFLDTTHHTFKFTTEQGLNALEDVIYHLETYDITTIRASTPMFLLSKYIKSEGIKMVLSGEGADELFGGYLYFLQAPSDEEFQTECQKRVKMLSSFDCLRANKSTMAHGVEGRFPFLDKEMVELAFKIHPKHKYHTNLEKWALRKAFDIKDNKGDPVYLPDEILWRQKEQFSDGVGYGWIDSVVEMCNTKYNDEEFRNLSASYIVNPPKTKEALYYRETFNKLFPDRESSVRLWKPKTEWANVGEDPSGRAQIAHNVKLN